jgi:hypothetical protein
MATGGSIRPNDEGPTEPYAFQRSQWTWVSSTDTGISKHRIVSFTFILPVDYTHAWFQEATWARIA